jgi:hypothetical protein
MAAAAKGKLDSGDVSRHKSCEDATGVAELKAD